MLTKLDKAWTALVSSGALMVVLPMLPGPFQDQKFDAAIVAVLTGLLTWLVPNKAKA
jgi:hypothetical protein